MKASLILYSAATQLTLAHQPLAVAGGVLFVRSELRFGECPLEHAKPQEGEIVLNTVPHPEEAKIASFMGRVTTILVEQLGITADQVKPEALFYGTGSDGSLGCDSLDTVELVMAAEEEFSVNLPDEDAETMTTVAHTLLWLLENNAT